MAENILKNTGRIILALIFVFIYSVLPAAEINTELSDSRIAVGESATLRIKINGKSSKVTPVKFPAVDGLQISFAGSSRSFQFINGKTWSGVVLSFSITAERKGEYRIPPFILETDGEKVSSAEVKLTVIESSSRGGAAGPLRGDIELTAETVFTGEPFIMRYYISNSGGSFPEVNGLVEQPHTKGFVIKSLDEKLPAEGKVHAGSFCLVPVDKGVHQIGGGAVEYTVDIPRGFFSMDRRGRLKFPYKKVNVIPIPSDGKPQNFSGDVGEFRIELDIPSGRFRAYEEIRIPVRISGRGNLLTLSRPRIENEDGIKAVIEEKEQTLTIEGKDLSGTRNYIITLIPQRDGAINPGRIFLEYFNPYKKVYQKAESVPLVFEVQKGITTGDKGEVQFSQNGSSSGNLYIYAAVIIALLAGSVILLVVWERKKLSIIRGELKGETPDEDPVKKHDNNDDILQNISISVKEKNSELFLLSVDRGLNRIDPSKLTVSGTAEYNHFRERINFCRYGGGSLSGIEMSQMSEWIKRNLN